MLSLVHVIFGNRAILCCCWKSRNLAIRRYLWAFGKIKTLDLVRLIWLRGFVHDVVVDGCALIKIFAHVSVDKVPRLFSAVSVISNVSCSAVVVHY